MNEEDLKKFIKDDNKLKLIVEIKSDLRRYRDISSMISMGFSVDYKEIPFFDAGIFGAIHYEENKRSYEKVKK